MKKTSKQGRIAWRVWGWISLVVLAFIGGFVPQYFRAEQLEKRLGDRQENYYQERIASSIAGLRETLARCRLFLCRGSGADAHRELDRFYSLLETLYQDPALRTSSREIIRNWMKTKAVNLADIHPPRLNIQDRLQELDKDLAQLSR